MNRNIQYKRFGEINLEDDFFSSLKVDYPEFQDWFRRNRERYAYVMYDEVDNVQGFLHLKNETSIVDDVTPQIVANKILKVATFKVNAHGTKLGEQFVKIIVDFAISERVDMCYVTIFPKHHQLISLVKSFGFEEYGTKGDIPNQEIVYVKNMKKTTGNINSDYPLIQARKANKYLLSIYPQYHSVMFPDSILTTENKNMLTDISYTNSIHKVYVCTMKVNVMKYGDIVVIYRTAESGKAAEYSAVATSVCVVEDVKEQSEFTSFEEFYDYVNQYSVFDKNDLRYWYNRGGCKAVKMTYNMALRKRITRHDLITKLGMCRNEYWGFMAITEEQFNDIIRYGEGSTHIIN